MIRGTTPYRDRVHAAQVLADALGAYAGRDDLVVLALPRGGVPVAGEVARVLGADVDLMVVRKLGYPGQEELAMGALASGGVRVLNQEVAWAVPEQALEQAIVRERRELDRRERAYRGDRPQPDLTGRCVILIDDGVATGSTMRAAIGAARERGAGEVVVAVPVAPGRTIDRLKGEADDVVCPHTPEMFFGIGQFYRDFSQTTDEEVRDILERAWGD